MMSLGRFRSVIASLVIGREQLGLNDSVRTLDLAHADAMGVLGRQDNLSGPLVVPSLRGPALRQALAHSLGHSTGTLQR
jgi:hypothetical protein